MVRSKELTNLQKELTLEERKKLPENQRQPKYSIYYYYFIDCEVKKKKKRKHKTV